MNLHFECLACGNAKNNPTDVVFWTAQSHQETYLPEKKYFFDFLALKINQKLFKVLA